MNELLPCPCCGGAASIDIERQYYSAGCEDCGLQTTYRESNDGAITAWNSRAPLPSVLPIPAPDPRYDARVDWSAS